MDIKLQQMASDFRVVMDLEDDSRRSFSLLEGKIKVLKDYYLSMGDYMTNSSYVFGLDSFRYQTRMIDLEYDDIQRIYNAYMNRMYGEYFKLYKIIDATIDRINNKKLNSILEANKDFPVYRDLEPFKKYDYKIITSLHETLLILINSIIGYSSDKEVELKNEHHKQDMGLNIDNFIFCFGFNNKVLEDKIALFINYLNFFHIIHLKYMKRFNSKVNLFISQINHDIIFDDSIKSINIRRKSIFTTFQEDEVSKELVKDIKESMNEDSAGESPNSAAYKEVERHHPSVYKLFPSIDNELSLEHPDEDEHHDPFMKRAEEYIKNNTPPTLSLAPQINTEEINDYFKNIKDTGKHEIDGYPDDPLA